jgi:hypothetical protein
VGGKVLKTSSTVRGYATQKNWARKASTVRDCRDAAIALCVVEASGLQKKMLDLRSEKIEIVKKASWLVSGCAPIVYHLSLIDGRLDSKNGYRPVL